MQSGARMIYTYPTTLRHTFQLADAMGEMDKKELSLYGPNLNRQHILEASWRQSSINASFMGGGKCWAMFGIMDYDDGTGCPWLISVGPEKYDLAMTRLLLRTIRDKFETWYVNNDELTQRMWAGNTDHYRLEKKLGFTFSDPFDELVEGKAVSTVEFTMTKEQFKCASLS